MSTDVAGPLLISREAGVGWVRLNVPERRNALSGQLLRELNAALKEADEFNPVHCVVLRGAGPHFCAGAAASRFATASTFRRTYFLE